MMKPIIKIRSKVRPISRRLRKVPEDIPGMSLSVQILEWPGLQEGHRTSQRSSWVCYGHSVQPKGIRIEKKKYLSALTASGQEADSRRCPQ